MIDTAVVDQGVRKRAALVAAGGMAHQATLLGEHNEIVVLIANVERDGLGNHIGGIVRLGQIDRNTVAGSHGVLFRQAGLAIDTYGTALNQMRAGRALIPFANLAGTLPTLLGLALSACLITGIELGSRIDFAGCRAQEHVANEGKHDAYGDADIGHVKDGKVDEGGGNKIGHKAKSQTVDCVANGAASRWASWDARSKYTAMATMTASANTAKATP